MSISPNEVLPVPACNFALPISVRYASSTGRGYVESESGGGCFTLTQVWEELSDKPFLFPIDPVTNEQSDVPTGTWLLSEDLYVLDDVTLNIFGTESGGDCDELRLLSDSTTFINLRGHGGSLHFKDTTVLSWDPSVNGPDTEIEDGRSYISCISEIVTDETLVCEGGAKNTMGECRMDISDSEISYLGYEAAESWGLSYKVRGFCNDESNFGVFEEVGVYGNIYDSEIHHNYYGHYSYGHQNGDWSRNIVHDNVQYGYDPHHASRRLTIHDNLVYNNGNHGIIASKWCTDVPIQGNEVHNSKVGIFPHSLGERAIVKNNYVHDNFDTGITFLESSDGEISGNRIENNNFGLRVSVGSRNNVFENNVFSGSISNDIYMYDSTETPVESETGRPSGNAFKNNTFEVSSGYEGIRVQNTDTFQFSGNTFTNGVGYVDARGSKNMLFSGNSEFILDTDEESCLDVSDVVFEGVEFCEFSVYDSPNVTFSPKSSPTGYGSTFAPSGGSTFAPSGGGTFAPSGGGTFTFSPSVSPTHDHTEHDGDIETPSPTDASSSKKGHEYSTICFGICLSIVMLVI